MFGWLRRKKKEEDNIQLFYIPDVPGASYTFGNSVEVGIIPLKDWAQQMSLEEFSTLVKASTIDWAECVLPRLIEDDLFEYANIVQKRFNTL